MPTPPDAVRLELPPSPRFLSAARVVAASLGADAGLSVDDLDDLRLGVNELVATLLDVADPSSRITLEFVSEDHTITVAGSIEGPSGAVEADELTQRIVAAVVDRYELGPSSFVLSKVSSLRERD